MPPPYTTQEQEFVTLLRTEPRMRVADYTPTITAQVHDALWMLTQQWRVKEFRGEDAGSVVTAKIETQTTLLNRFKSRNGLVEPLETTVPLEAKVERLPMPLDFGFGLQIAYQWFRLLRYHQLAAGYDAVFTTAYQIDTSLLDTPLLSRSTERSNVRVMQIRQALRGRMMDGLAFWNFLQGGGHAKDVAGVNAGDQAAMDAAEADLKSWFARVYYQPPTPADNSWSETQLEYQFALSAPTSTAVAAPQTVFRADRYQLGKIDWYAVDIDDTVSAKLVEPASTPISNAVIEAPYVESYLPHTISFKGMPNGRWWEFEDRNIDLARMMTQKQDIVKMIVLEFGVIYSNDWFVFPHSVKNGSITHVNGLVTKDVFGRQFQIQRAGSRATDNWQRWDMYNIDKKANGTVNRYDQLLLMPNLLTRQEGEPLEKILFLRDEMANMVWGVEEVVPDELLAGRNGKHAADELMDYLLQQFVPTVPAGYIANDAKLRYRLSTSVPENWIPFVAAQGTVDRQTMLQRAAMFRHLGDNYTPERIRPRTRLLSIGLPTAPYKINEEEVSRSGFVISTTFKRTRWYNGQVYTWLGHKVQSGRGEGASGLKFDWLQDKEADEQASLPLTGALAWWRADDPQNVVVGSHYQTLHDNSGNGNHLSAAAASKRPAVLANWKNDRPALGFTGGQALRLPSLILPADTTDFTVFLVGEKTSAGAAGVVLEFTDDYNSNAGWAYITNDQSLDYAGIRQSGYNSHGVPNNTTLNQKGLYVIGLNAGDPDPETSVEFNDTVYATPYPSLSQTDNTALFSNASFNIGSRAGNSVFCQFRIAEIILYPFKATAAQRAVIKTYLKARYAF